MDLQNQLINKSLIYLDEQNRYQMLETIREYARSKYQQAEEQTLTQEYHLAYFLKLAEEAAPKLKGPDQVEWLKLIEKEQDNLRQALKWSLVPGASLESGLRLGSALAIFWERKGFISEGQELLGQLRKGAIKAGLVQNPYYARVIMAAGELVNYLGDPQTSSDLLDESLQLFLELGDKAGIAAALSYLARKKMWQTNYEEATRDNLESLVLYHELNDQWGVAATLGNSALMAFVQGDYENAKRTFQHSLLLLRQLGDKRFIAEQLKNLGVMAYCLNQYEEAQGYIQESLGLVNLMGDRIGKVLILIMQGRVENRQEKFQEALPYFKEALILSLDIGYKRGIALSLSGMAQIFNKCVALNLNEQKPQAIGNRSEVDFYLQWAARLCGVVAAIYSEIGLEVGPPAQNEFNSAKEEVLARLGQETFARLYIEGQLIPLQEIINTLLLFIGTFVKGATCSS